MHCKINNSNVSYLWWITNSYLFKYVFEQSSHKNCRSLLVLCLLRWVAKALTVIAFPHWGQIDFGEILEVVTTWIDWPSLRFLCSLCKIWTRFDLFSSRLSCFRQLLLSKDKERVRFSSMFPSAMFSSNSSISKLFGTDFRFWFIFSSFVCRFHLISALKRSNFKRWSLQPPQINPSSS